MLLALFLAPWYRSQVGEEVPFKKILQNGYCMVPIGRGTFQFVQVRMRYHCLMLLFLVFSLVRFMLPWRSGLQEEDIIMAPCAQGLGNGQSRESGHHEPSISCHNIPIHLYQQSLT